MPLQATTAHAGPGRPPAATSAAARPEQRIQASLNDRVTAAVLAVAALTLLIFATAITPSPDGHGTHTQLGLPSCGWLAATGRPCPTCGMTTAFAHVANLQILRAFQAQPAGALLAIGTAVAFWGCLHVAVFGSRLGVAAGRLLRPRVLWIAGAIAVASWLYKIAAMTGFAS